MTTAKKHILLVDDDEAFLKMTCLMLKDNYDVSTASSGRGALTLIKELLRQGKPPVLVILDVDMPDMDGYETLQKLDDIGEMAGTPVLFLTGMTETSFEIKALQSGAADYITKPFFKAVLLERIRLRLEESERLKAARRKEEKLQHSPYIKELTPWERKIAELAHRRLSYKEIAQKMDATPNTIRTALYSIYNKLDIHSRQELEGLNFEAEQ
jgi:DNA-binding NarL/FixJ family response regulator